MMMKKDMVLGDVKRLFHELRTISAKLLDLRKQYTSKERFNLLSLSRSENYNE
jgi:hypothetical protein